MSPSSSRPAVVVTGFGAVNAVGCGREPTAAALASGTPAWSEVERPAGYHRRGGGARLAGLAAGHDLSAWVSAGAARRMSLGSKLAVAAARMALADAGIVAGAEVGGKPTAMVFSNAFGPSMITEKILTQIESEGPLAVSPALFTESVANAPAAQVAIVCRALGANVTVTQREAGALIALARAAGEVARGRAGYALVVAVDEVTPLLHAVFDRFGALSRPDAGGEEARPFDRRRNGFILGEGATALVVETAESAAQRGDRVLARFLGTASAFDPEAPATGWGSDPAALTPALERLLARAGDVDAVVCGASGSVAGDRLEAHVLKAVWDGRPPRGGSEGEARRLPPLLAPKAVLGEFGGAQLAAAVLALAGEPCGPTPGFSEVDPELGVTPWAGGEPAPSALLISSLATGGAAAWAVLARAAGTLTPSPSPRGRGE